MLQNLKQQCFHYDHDGNFFFFFFFHYPSFWTQTWREVRLSTGMLSVNVDLIRWLLVWLLYCLTRQESGGGKGEGGHWERCYSFINILPSPRFLFPLVSFMLPLPPPNPFQSYFMHILHCVCVCVCVFFFLVVVTDAHEGLYIYHVLEFNSECHLKRGKQNTLQCLGHFHVY